jgi:uncharacterized protein (TIGR03435 family)
VIIAKSVTIADLVQMLQNYILGQPLVDKTGLEWRWDFPLRWTPDERDGNVGQRHGHNGHKKRLR